MVEEDIETVSSMITSSRLTIELSRCLLAKRRKTYKRKKRNEKIDKIKI
jgi:hypothetical protein